MVAPGNERIQVLHVADDPDSTALTEQYLEREDGRFAVETTTSAAEALTEVRDSPPDCVVSDYDMPGTDGIEFLEAVREEHPDLPFILFTGEGSEEVASDAISAGVTDYLRKSSATEQFELLADRIGNAVSEYRAERGGERERDRGSALFENMAEAIAYYEFEGGEPVVREVNPAFEATFDVTSQSVRGTPLDDIVVPPAHTTEAEEINERVSAGEVVNTEVERVAADGLRTFNLLSVPLGPAETGERGYAVYTDISERMEHEQELQRQRDRYQSLFESTNDAVAWTEYEGETPIIREANPRFREQFEPPGEDVLGEPLDEVVTAPERREKAEEISRRVKEGAHQRGELRRDTIDGPRTFIWEAIPYTPPGADEVQNTHAIYTDITERKEREREVREHREQLERREQKLIRLRDYTQALMYAATPSETADIALSAVDEILGFDLGAVFTQSETQEGLLELVEVLNRSRMEKMYGGLPTFLRDSPAGTHSDLAWEVFESGESVFINDTAESTKLTRKSPFGSLMLYPIGRHGVVLLAATTLEAFTETEEILLDLLATALETAFDRLDREQDLRRQRDELERQNERLDEFVSVVSHDLRNPLNVASGRLELATDECDSDHLEDVAGALDRMGTLIEDLLHLARDGERVDDLEPVAVADLCRACWGTVATGDASLVVETDRTVQADRSRLKQLLENLIRNAVEHGGTDVTITVGDSDGGFYVADDGPGIDETDSEKVFEAGYSENEDSTGFGLNIVREIVGAHGWEISVTDSEDGGARFEITDLETVA